MTKDEAKGRIEKILAYMESLDADEEEVKDIDALNTAIKALDKRKTGKWIFGETMGHSWMKCSECCKSQDGQTLCFTYCPNCGAKMEGADEQDKKKQAKMRAWVERVNRIKAKKGAEE